MNYQTCSLSTRKIQPLCIGADMWTYKYIILVHEQTATQRYTSIEKAAFAASIFLMSMAAQGKTPKVWVCKAEIGNVP